MKFLTRNTGSYFLIFLFFLSLVFFVYQKLFFSYFESDEWVHLTYYFPLTQKPDGFWQAIWGTMYHTTALSQGMHVIPIAWGLFYLDTLFFGMDFTPYAFITLVLHAINSFLVFFLVRLFLPRSYIAPIIAGVFFALTPTPIHAITGAAPFYGQNVLSVTFLLLCLIYFKKAFLAKKKLYLLITSLFLFSAVLSKETTAFLFLLLPIIAFFEKRIFSMRWLMMWFGILIFLFIFIRFALPQIALVLDHKMSSPEKVNQIATTETYGDSTAITNTDLSIHENLGGEILFRTVTYPIRTFSQVYFSRQTISSLVQEVVLFVYPKPGNEESLRSQNRLAFSTGPANDFLIYFLSICLIALVIYKLKQERERKSTEKVHLLYLGIFIIILSTLPLVAIIFSFPRWGYDTYFDSRHYYAPAVGGALLFPFLLITLGQVISHSFSQLLRFRIPSVLIAIVLFYLWIYHTLIILSTTMEGIVEKTGQPRREIVAQIQRYQPTLPGKVVFHIETDGLGAYGTKLPFQTSIPQMLSLIYYEKNPLPDAFYATPILAGKANGYQESEGRGFGYFDSKVSLAEALQEKRFSVDDVYSYYHESQKNIIHDKTKETRSEMKQYIDERREVSDWQEYQDASSAAKILFRYPSETVLNEVIAEAVETPLIKTFYLSNGDSLQLFTIPLTFDLKQFISLRQHLDSLQQEEKEVVFDRYHTNDVQITSSENEVMYYLQLPTLLIVAKTEGGDDSEKEKMEKILGSITALN